MSLPTTIPSDTSRIVPRQDVERAAAGGPDDGRQGSPPVEGKPEA